MSLDKCKICCANKQTVTTEYYS